MSTEHGPTPEYPDVAPLYPRFYAGGLPPEHSQHEIEQIAGERSREDETLQRHRGHLCGSDSSAIAANNALAVSFGLPQHPDQHPRLLTRERTGTGTLEVDQPTPGGFLKILRVMP
jgi:hypothetical protein